MENKMKAKSILKRFTVVSFLITGMAQIGFASDAVETNEACRKRVQNDEKESIHARCSQRKSKGIDGNYHILEGVELEDCKKTELKNELMAECDHLESAKDIRSRCDQALKSYDEAVSKTDEQCGLIKSITGESVRGAECREKANLCKSGSMGFTDGHEGSGTVQSIANIYGMMSSVNGGHQNENSNLNGCFMENDEKAAEKESTIDDKITKMREDISELKEDATKADQDLNEKRQDVEEKINEAEAEFEKDKFEKQKTNAERIAQIQKMVLASQKKRRDNDRRIVEKHIEIANLTFAEQKINLTLAESTIKRTCNDMATAMVNKAKNKIDGQSGKSTSIRYSHQEALRIKKDIKAALFECLQTKALEKQAAAKSIIDNRRKLQADIAAYEASSVDEAKAIENELKNMEDLKTIAAEEEKKAIETKLKKMNTLNQSVVDMEKFVTEKKRTYAEKAIAKEEQIKKIILDRQNIKSRFVKVSSAANASGRMASTYLEQCCTAATRSQNQKGCTRVMRSEDGDEMVPSDAREYQKAKEKEKVKK